MAQRQTVRGLVQKMGLTNKNEDRELRGAVLEYLDEVTGSKEAVSKLNKATIERHLEEFLSTGPGRRYFSQSLISPTKPIWSPTGTSSGDRARGQPQLLWQHNVKKEEVMRAFPVVTLKWIKRRHNGKKPQRQPIPPTRPVKRPKLIESVSSDDEPLVNNHLRDTLYDPFESGPGEGFTPAQQNLRDATIRPDSPKTTASKTTPALTTPRTPQKLRSLEETTTESELPDLEALHSSWGKRKREPEEHQQIALEYEQTEEDTEDEAEAARNTPGGSRSANPPHRSDHADDPPQTSEVVTESATQLEQNPVLFSPTTQNTPVQVAEAHPESPHFEPNIPPVPLYPSRHELPRLTAEEINFWPQMLLHMILQRQRYAVKQLEEEAGTLDPEDGRVFDNVFRAFSNLRSDVEKIRDLIYGP